MIHHRSVKSYYGNSGLTGIPRGLCLRRFFWKAMEEADENVLNTQLADMRDPEGVGVIFSFVLFSFFLSQFWFFGGGRG